MIKDIAITAATRVLLVLAGLVSSVIVVRLLGAEGRGVFFYWSTIAGLAVQLGNAGLPSSNTFYLARNHHLLPPLAANALVCALLVGLAAVLLLQVWPRPDNDSHFVLVFATGVLASGGLYYLLGVNLLAALQRYREFNVFELLNRYVAVVLIGIVAFVWRSPEATLVGAAIASVAVCIPLFFRLLSLSSPPTPPSFKLFVEGLSFAFRAYVATLLGFLVLRFNAVYLEWIAGSKILGEWSIAAQLLDAIGILPTAIAVVLFPAMLRSEAPYQHMRTNLRLAALAMLAVCAMAAALGRLAIVILFGAEHTGAYTMLLAGLPSSFAIGLLSVVSQFLAAIGFPWTIVAIWAIGLAIEILISVLVVPELGAIGAMIALSSAHVTIFLMAWGLAYRLRHAVPQPVHPSPDGSDAS